MHKRACRTEQYMANTIRPKRYNYTVSSYCIFTYHLLTETEGNSVFCGPETDDVSRGEVEGNIDGRESTKHTAFPRSQ